MASCRGVQKVRIYCKSGRENKRLHQNTQEINQVYDKSYELSQLIIHSNAPETARKINQPTHQNNTALYSHKDITKVQNVNLSDAFQSIRTLLGGQVIGQENYLDQLCIAFKRPFVTGFDQDKPKNAIVVLGNKGTGRRSSFL